MYYYAYILLCEDGSYYTGCAKNVKYRFEQHKKGRGGRYTRIHKPLEIVHVEKFDSRREAMKRERIIKSLNHSQKQKLISRREAN